MADQLYLSYVLRGFTENNMLRHFERMLRLFPYSRLSKGSTFIRVQAVSVNEPAIFEKGFDRIPEVDVLLRSAKEFQCADCGIYVDTWWDLWQHEDDWKLAPSRVTLACFAPQYEAEGDEDLRIDFGIDSLFLPQPDLPNQGFMSQSNIRSLLHLVNELDRTLAFDSRRLWTESGENFAEKLQALASPGAT